MNEILTHTDRKTQRLVLWRKVLLAVAAVIFVASVVLTEIISLSAIHGKDNTIAQLKAGQKAQNDVAACRSDVSGEWVNALDGVIKQQGRMLVVVTFQPIDPEALAQVRNELDSANKALDKADLRRANIDVECPPPS